MIHLSDTLELPDDLVTQPCAILARRGAGKTYTASVMTEELLEAGLPVVVLDPLGAWESLPEGAALRDYWLTHERVTAAGRAFLQVLFDRYPETIHRDDLAVAADYSPTSRHVDNTLGALRTLGIVEGGRDAISAAPVLFGDAA